MKLRTLTVTVKQTAITRYYRPQPFEQVTNNVTTFMYASQRQFGIRSRAEVFYIHHRREECHSGLRVFSFDIPDQIAAVPEVDSDTPLKGDSLFDG